MHRASWWPHMDWSLVLLRWRLRAVALWGALKFRWRMPKRPVKGPLVRWSAKSHSIIDKLYECVLLSQYFETRAAEIGSSHADAHPAAGFFTQYAAGRSAGNRAYPLFLRPPCRWNSRISAARPVSIADDYLQKQQKQRERRLAKGLCGSLSGRPRGSGYCSGGDAAT
jgi:hypothetical protein